MLLLLQLRLKKNTTIVEKISKIKAVRIGLKGIKASRTTERKSGTQ